MLCVPSFSVAVANVAVPLVSVAVPNVVVPSRKVTVPVGVGPNEPVTVAVKVTEWPYTDGFEDDSTVVAVGETILKEMVCAFSTLPARSVL